MEKNKKDKNLILKNIYRMTTGLMLSIFMVNCNIGQKEQSNKGASTMLSPAPTNTVIIHEMAFEFDDKITTAFNSLSQQERIMVYYLQQAGATCTPLFIDHIHRHGLRIIDLFNTLHQHSSDLAEKTNLGFSAANFNKDVYEFLHYLLANHGQYFQREHGNAKRSPAKIGLSTLTQQNVIQAFEVLDLPEDAAFVKEQSAIIFDAATEPTLNVSGSIEKSAVNFYAKGFTEEDYQSIPAEKRGNINTYFDIAIVDGKRTPVVVPYAIGHRYSEELTQACGWLSKAYDLALKYPENFDNHFAESLRTMIEYLSTGNEDFFKKHSIAWLQSKSKLDYCFGFIECYDDPKGIRSSFQGEVTVKSLDITKLNALLPAIEATLPFPSAFKRDGVEDGTASIPNASINVKIFGMGHLGPMSVTAAYCLPNYSEIRASHGSKQIIYPSDKGLAQRLQPEKARRLFNLKERADWLAQHDPEGMLSRDIWDVQCILHETIGHASGKLATHTFKEGDKLTISNVTHKVGDTIPVTNNNIAEFLNGYDSSLEELRAEIVAQYVSVEYLDTLLQANFLTKWLSVMDKETLQKNLILGMAKTGLNRLLQLSDNATEITGAHAQANSVIMNYLIDNGGLTLAEEPITIDDKEFVVLGLTFKDFAKTRQLIKELLLEVQRIKSTADGQAVTRLFETYGTKIRNKDHIRYLQACREHLVGKVKASVTIYPVFEPVVDPVGQVIDCTATWPQNFLDGYSKTHPQLVHP
jgi:hypothetical protein